MKFITALLLPGLLSAAILPETLGSYHRTKVGQPALADRPVWDEYGLKEAETAAYEDGPNVSTVTAWRLQDTTGAMAAFEWQRPAKAAPSKAGALAAETSDTLMLVHGNYLLSFAGHKPDTAELGVFTGALKNVDHTALPVLASYLPSDGLVPNSERYATGPAGLEKFGPKIPPSVAGFRFGAEARIGVFHGPKGDMTLAIFNYPTHQIAMERVPEFEKIPGAAVKRSGPLVAVTLSPADPDFAERVLGQVRYQAEVTRDEYVPTQRDNPGLVILNIIFLIGILLAGSIVCGLALGGFRTVLQRGRKGVEAEPMIRLHLE